ncbi:unnamed protein product, partial [Medioppia subpectinata]
MTSVMSVCVRNTMRNMYFNAIMSLFSISSTVSVLTGFQTPAPKLTLLSPALNGDTVDIMANTSLHLKCTGDKPMYWQFPNNNPQYDPVVKVAQIRSKCDDNQHLKCVTDVVIPEVDYEMTGHFTCLYNDSTISERSDTIYVYVNGKADPEYLIVPYEGNYDFMFIAVFQSQPATIPCKPTDSRAKVSLWKVHTNSGIPQEIVVNNTLGITYNAKKGYHFEYPRWDGETSLLECKVELDGIEMISQISIHWSILPVELHPLIDDSRAKNVFINSTFTLKCFVHIELGVIIVITWDVPNHNTLERFTESMAETQRIELNGNSYDTVSKNLTITDAQMEDDGNYHCNVTDGNGRVFSTSKKVTVYENGLPPSYVNFSMDINNNKPLISKVGEMLGNTSDMSTNISMHLLVSVIANQSGAYRCFATNDNTTTIHSQISFIVTDAINGFSIISSTDEPTVREDISLTCKASVYNYTELNWIRKPLDGIIESEDEYNLTDISAPVMIESNMKDNVIEKTPYTQLELRCMVRGRPKPVITWYRNKKPFIVTENTGIKLEDRNQILTFTRILDKDSGLYECEAHNSGGTVKRSARLKVDSPEDTTSGLSTEEIIVFVLFVVVGTVMIFMAIYIGKKIRQERKQKRELEFLSHNLFETGQIEMFNPDMPLDEQIELLPYDPRYEFPKERLKLESVRYADIMHNQQTSGSYTNGYITTINSAGQETGQDSSSANGSGGYRGESIHKRNKDKLVTTCDLLLCWRAEPKDRPDFMEIADIIGALLESNVRQ